MHPRNCYRHGGRWRGGSTDWGAAVVHVLVGREGQDSRDAKRKAHSVIEKAVVAGEMTLLGFAEEQIAYTTYDAVSIGCMGRCDFCIRMLNVTRNRNSECHTFRYLRRQLAFGEEHVKGLQVNAYKPVSTGGHVKLL